MCYAVIITSTTVLDLAKDFTALMIISEFDNQFANFSREKIATDAVNNSDGTYTDLFMIDTTTSDEARGGGNSILFDKDEAWKMILKRRHWKLWESLKKENKETYNVNFVRFRKR